MTQSTQSPTKDLDARFYKNHSDIQYRLSLTPLRDYHFTSYESILDIGCGDGKITAQLAQYVPNGHVIGIDKSASVIDFARNDFPEQDHPNLRFKKIDACSFKFSSPFDLITSFSCLHWIKKQKSALQNIQQHLKPKAKTLIVTFPRCSSFWDPIDAVAHSQKWRSFFEQDLYPHSFLDETQYKILLAEVNLKILFIETTSHVTKFVGKQGFENYVRGWLPFFLYLPQQFHQEFLTEIGNKSLEFAPVQEDGYVYHPYEKIVIYAQRN